MRLLFLLLGSAVAIPAALAQPAIGYHGRWQGEVLMQVASESGLPLASFAVHPGAFDIADNGSVRGRIAAAGCTLTGSSADFVTAANASIDVDVGGCKDPRFNGRFSGKLIINPLLDYASLRLSRLRPPESGTPQLSAILRR